jgi:ribose 1,5-bisphosphokinase PhnN
MAPAKRFNKRWAMSLSTEDKCLIEGLAAQGRQSEGEIVRRLVRAEAERIGLFTPLRGRGTAREMFAPSGG